MKLRSLRLLAFLMLPLPSALAAQLPVPVTVEARAGLAIPVGDFASATGGLGAESGPGFAAALLVEPLTFVGLYAGYQQLRFGCPRCAEAGLDGTVVLAGPEAGFQLRLPVDLAGGAPWFRAGVLYHNLAFSGMGDRMTSEVEVGFGTAAGMSIPLGGRVAILPAVRFHSVPARFEFSILPDRPSDVTAVSFDVGLAYGF